MESDPQAILDAALNLPEYERLLLVTRLLDSLPPEDIGLSLEDPHLFEELDRRSADRSGVIPWSELKEEN